MLAEIDVELACRSSLDPERKLHLLQLETDSYLAELFLNQYRELSADRAGGGERQG